MHAWGRRGLAGQLVGLLVASAISTTGCRSARDHVTATPRAGSRCPAAPVSFDAVAQSGDLADQAALSAAFEAASAYGAAHPDDFTDARLDYSQRPARLVVAFSAHVQEHRAALETQLVLPERVDIVEVRHSRTELEAIVAAIGQDLMAGRVESVGIGWLAVDVEMGPGREAIASDYVDRWGDAVRITLGGLTFVPKGCGEAPVAAPCAPLRGSDPATGGIELAVQVDTPNIAATDTGSAHLQVRNVGLERFEMDTGQPILGVLVRPGTNDVVGRWTGILGGTGLLINLLPGESAVIDVFFGATRCDGQPGSALPPGRYGLRVALTPEAGPTRAVYLSPESPVTITA